MSVFRGNFEVKDDLFWWKSLNGKAPYETRYSVYGILGTIDEPEPNEIDKCRLVLFHFGTRDEMVKKLKNERGGSI